MKAGIYRSAGRPEGEGLWVERIGPVDRIHTDTGLVRVWVEWESQDAKQALVQVWRVPPDTAPEFCGGGGVTKGGVLVQFEALKSGTYVFDIREGPLPDVTRPLAEWKPPAGEPVATAPLEVVVGWS